MSGESQRRRIFLTDCRISENGNIIICGQNCEAEDSVDKLMENIKACSHSLQRIKSIEVGEMCLALFAEDGMWYRALVTDRYGSDYSVEFIDYGNIQSTSLDNLREIPDRFTSLDPQAQSFLFDPQGGPASSCGTWTSNVAKAVNDQYLYAEIEIDITETPSKQLIGRSDAVSQTLEEMGYVDRNKPSELFSVLGGTKEDSTIKSEKYVVGQKMNVIISVVETDGSFFCYNAANGHLLNEMLDSLYEACENRMLRPLPECKIGKECCARYSLDGNWYRAEIIADEPDKKTVRFVDYGNTDHCDKASLMTLREDFRNLPRQAIHCSLSGSSETEKLIRILQPLQDKEVMLEIVNCDCKPYVVRLCDNGTVVGLASSPHLVRQDKDGCAATQYQASYKLLSISLGSSEPIILKNASDVKSMWCVLAEDHEKLLGVFDETNEIYRRVADDQYELEPDQSDLNRPCVTFDTDDKCWHRTKILSLAGVNQYKVLYVDCGKIKLVDSRAVRIISDGLLRFPAFAVRFTLTAFHSASGDSVPLAHCQSLLPSLVDKSFVAVFNSYDKEKDLYFVELHDVGRHIGCALSQAETGIPDLDVSLNVDLPVRITSIDDPDCIWIQLLDYKSEMITLNGKLNAYYNVLPSQALALKDVYRGQVCCIKSSKTKNWSRAEIEYLYDDLIEVKFVDYGYIDSICVSEAKVLLPEFMSLPKQAVCCKFHNLKPATSRWCNGSVRYLKEFVAKAGITANFCRERGRVFSGQMYICFRNERILISEGLISEGFAAWIDQSIAEMISQESLKAQSNESVMPSTLPTSKVLYSHCGNELIGAEIAVQVCDSPSPSDFFILPRSSNAQHTYNKLARELKTYLNSSPASFVEVYVGMPCVCVIGRDCFRAAIVSEVTQPNVTVFLVDFGVKKKVNTSDLRNITSEHITCIPPVAIRCTLHGIVEPKSEFWSSNAMLEFTNFCKQATKHLICTIYACVTDGTSQFFMANLSTPFQDIAHELVNTCHCRLVTPMGSMSLPFSLKSFVYSNLGVGIGKEDLFYITHVERDDLFYCQIKSNFSVIGACMDRVQEYCREKKSQKQLTHDELSFSPPCFARYNTEWYRALYKSISLQCPKEAIVFFVDYGNLVSVPLSDIIPFEWKSGLADVPVQAIPCSLSELVSPIQDSQKSESTFEEMKNLLCGEGLRGVVTGCTNGKFHLDLFIDERRVNDQITGSVSPASVMSALSDFNEAANDSLLKGKFKEVGSIGPKTIHTVYFCHIVDPDNFHVRLESQEDAFNECTSEVDGFYTATRRQDYSVTVLQSGDIVCAKHPTAFRWCRGVVVDADSYKPDKAVVEFVDFGDKATVSIEDHTKKLMESMLQWPRMTIRCKLANVLPLGKCWKSDNINFFDSTCKGVQCRMRFSSFDVTDGVWTVDLKIKGKNIAHLLVENNHARFARVPSSTVSSNAEVVKTKPIDLWKPGAMKKVYISHVESASEVYFQLMEYEDALNKMMQELNAPSLKFRSATRPNLKQSYVSRYEEDGRFYRTNVISFDMPIEIIYVDYGNRAFVKIEDLHILPKEFSTFPEQAVKCKVSTPFRSDKNAVLIKLEEIAEDESVTLRAKCSSFDADSSSLEVQLYVSRKGGVETRFEDLLGSESKELEPTYEADVNAPVRKFTKPDLKVGFDMKVYVSQVDGPEQIWIQLSKYTKELDSLMSEIDSLCNGNSSQPLKVFEVGTTCLAKYYDDNGWYRGEILNLFPAKNEALIHFVDYGNSDTVQTQDMREIDIAMLELPKQAVKCRLLDLEGIHGWKSADTDHFVERVSDVELSARFFPCKTIANMYDIKLIYPCGKSLNDEWNETLRNRSPYPIAPDGGGDVMPSGLSDTSSSLPNQHIVSDRGDHVIVENLVPVPTNLDLDTSVDVRLTSEIPSVTLKMLAVQTGAVEDGYISHCEDPGHFFVQLAKYASDMDKICEFVSKSAQYSMEGSVEVGKYYVAKCLDDGEWYRAKCTKMEQGKCTVSYTDYGNTACIGINDIRPMHEELHKFAVHAIECQINGLKPKTGSWGGVTDFFLELALDKDLKIKFVGPSESGCWNVDLKVEDLDVREQISNKFGNLVCCNQEENTAELKSPLRACVQVGAMLCMKVLDVRENILTAMLLNFPFHLLQNAMTEFLKDLGDDWEKHLQRVHELKTSSIYLWKTLEWHCVKVIDPGEGIDLSTKEIVKFDEDCLFICPPAPVNSLAESILIESVIDQSNLETSTLVNKVVAAEFLSQDEQKRWIVRISFLSHKLDGNVPTPKVVATTPPSAVIVTKVDETEKKMAIKKWSLQHITDLCDFFSKGFKIFKTCPEVLVPFRNQLLKSKSTILSNLPEEERNAFGIHAEDSSIGDTLKRFGTNLAEVMNGKELPPKKIKLDMMDPMAIENQEVDEMFSVGDQFEAVISKIDHPGRFFVRPFLVMSEPATPAEPQCKDIKKKSKKIVQNRFCIAKCDNVTSKVHHWVRAKVEDCEDENFLLTDVDTGAEFFAKAENIFPVGEAIKSWPSFCLECALAGVIPINRSGDCAEWSESASAEIKSLLGNVNISDCVEISILSICRDASSGKERYNVDVRVNEISLAESLISLQLANATINWDKENITYAAKVDVTHLGRSCVRKPLADLMPAPHLPSVVITPDSSESIGELVPDFDLLAVPWKIIRTSIESSQPESLSDSVFVSDAEESFVGYSAQPLWKTVDFAGKKHLASFKIYCSTKSSVSSQEDATLDAESMEKSLPKEEENNVEFDMANDNAAIGSITSSLLDLLTPVTSGSGGVGKETSRDAGVRNSVAIATLFDPQEELLNETACKLVEDVFHQIEIEEDASGGADIVDAVAVCTIPDSLDDLESDDVSSQREQNHDECTIADSLCEIPAPNEVKAKQGFGYAAAGSSSEVRPTEELKVMYSAGIHTEKEGIQPNSDESLPARLLAITEGVGMLDCHPRDSLSAESEVVESLQNLALSGCGAAMLKEEGNLDLCEIPHPSDLKMNSEVVAVMENLTLDGIPQPPDLEKTDTEPHNNDLLEIPHPEMLVTAPDEQLLASKSKINFCVSDKKPAKPFVTSAEASSCNLKLCIGEGAENGQDSLKLDRSTDDIDYYSAEESLVEIPAPDSDDVDRQTVFPGQKTGRDEASKTVSHDECLPECDQLNTLPRLSLDAYERQDLPKSSINSAKVDDSSILECLSIVEDESLGQQSKTLTETLKAMKIQDKRFDSMQRSEKESLSVSHSSGSTLTEEEEEVLDLLRNMSIEDDPPEDKEKSMPLTALEDQNSCQMEEPEFQIKEDACSALHQQQKFYICCLPKMQLEVGDTYQVSFMNSKDPHSIQLQFDFGSDTEDWRKAVCHVNTQENVEKLQENESWEPDMMCLVQSLCDSSWERGRIASVDDKCCQVELIDYGETMTASKNMLREIPENLCLYPRQSALCWLAGIAKAKEHPPNINQHLVDLLFCSSMKAEVVEICKIASEENYGVRLFLIESDGEVRDVAKLLVDAGLAEIPKRDEEYEKTEDDDSAWETILHSDATCSDVMHSSNVDLSNLEEAFPREGILADSAIIDAPSNGSKLEKQNRPSAEQIDDAAREIQTTVIANALIIARFGSDDPLGDKSPVVKRRKKSKDVYIDLEKIPQILVEAYESTEIN